MFSNLIEWITDGDHIVIMMDTNEHIQTGDLELELEEMWINKDITARDNEKLGFQPAH